MALGQRSHHETLDGHALVNPLHHGQAEIAAHQAGHHDFAAARDNRDRERHRLLVAGEIDDLIKTALGLPDNSFNDVGLGGIVGGRRAVLQRGFPRGGI